MECPVCGKPMEEGYLSSKGPVFWIGGGLRIFPADPGRGDVLLG
ncbi:MAG: PF20097 family protein [Dysosmobacter sp.]